MNKFSTTLLFSATLLASNAYVGVAAAADTNPYRSAKQLSTDMQSVSAIRVPSNPLIDLPGGDIDPDSEVGQIQQAASQSDAVLLAKVISKESKWVGKIIITTATMDVVETMKGKSERRIRVSYPGGVVGPIAQYVTHTPALQIGETAVVFIDEPKSDALRDLDSFEFSAEKAKIAILAPEQNEARLDENVRLKRNLNRIRAAVK